MNTSSLAIVFAPGLLRTRRKMTAQESLSQVDKQCRTIELMLTATLRKLNSTLTSLDQIETQEALCNERLSAVRSSMREAKSVSV